MGQFLDPVAKPKLEVAAARVRRALPEDGLPLLLQLGHRHRFQYRSSARTSIPAAWRAGAAFTPDFLVFFLMRHLQLGFEPVSDDGV